MSDRPTPLRLAIIGLAAGALVFVAACSSTAATAAPVVSAAPGASAAPVVSTLPAAGSTAPESSVAPVVPGFSLPSDDKGLEALLPSTICGQPAIKTSMSGASLAAGADPAFTATLTQLGKSASDVAFAISTGNPAKVPTCGVTAGVFEIKGADSGQLQTVFLAAAVAEEKAYTAANVGGKDVYVDASDPTSKNYFYVKGDAVFFVSAPDDTTGATILSSMP